MWKPNNTQQIELYAVLHQIVIETNSTKQDPVMAISKVALFHTYQALHWGLPDGYFPVQQNACSISFTKAAINVFKHKTKSLPELRDGNTRCRCVLWPVFDAQVWMKKANLTYKFSVPNVFHHCSVKQCWKNTTFFMHIQNE